MPNNLFYELKESLIPISETIAREQSNLPIWLVGLLFGGLSLIVAIVIFFTFRNSQNEDVIIIVRIGLLTFLTAAGIFILLNNYEQKATNSYEKYTRDDQPFLEFLASHSSQVDIKTIKTLRTKETEYNFLWVVNDKETSAYLDEHDSIESITITSKKPRDTKRLTLFVVYKDNNKVILKSEDGEIALSYEQYEELKKVSVK